jgi:hypothetical protein
MPILIKLFSCYLRERIKQAVTGLIYSLKTENK